MFSGARKRHSHFRIAPCSGVPHCASQTLLKAQKRADSRAYKNQRFACVIQCVSLKRPVGACVFRCSKNSNTPSSYGCLQNSIRKEAFSDCPNFLSRPPAPPLNHRWEVRALIQWGRGDSGRDECADTKGDSLSVVSVAARGNGSRNLGPLVLAVS